MLSSDNDRLIQTGLKEVDYLRGNLGFKLQVERMCVIYLIPEVGADLGEEHGQLCLLRHPGHETVQLVHNTLHPVLQLVKV